VQTKASVGVLSGLILKLAGNEIYAAKYNKGVKRTDEITNWYFKVYSILSNASTLTNEVAANEVKNEPINPKAEMING